MGFQLMRRPPTRREALDEVLPDGTPAGLVLLRRRPSAMFPPPSDVAETPPALSRPVVETAPDEYAPLVRPYRAVPSQPELPQPAPPYGPINLQPSPLVAPSLSSLRRIQPEDIKPSRRLPMPGEEAANDEAFARRLAQYPDVAPVIDAGLYRRDRVERPVEFLENRVAEDLSRPVLDHNGGVRSTLLGLARGFVRGGLPGAVEQGIRHGFDHSLDEKEAAARLLSDDTERYARARQTEAAGLKAEGDRLSNEVKAAQIPYLLDRPEREWAKINNRQAYDAWRMSSGDRKADSAESYIQWRMQNGDRRATTAEGLAELRAEYVREIQPAQFERRQGETERNNRVNNALGGERVRQGDERIGLAREGLTLRERIASGNLDATWARIGQGYDRLDADRQKQVDRLAEKAAKAEADATYFDETGATQTDAAKKAQASATAKSSRAQAAELRRQAEAITNRPAPRATRPASPRNAPRRQGADPLGLFN